MYNKKKKHTESSKPHYHRKQEEVDQNTQNAEQKDSQSTGENTSDNQQSEKSSSSNRYNRNRRYYKDRRNKNRNNSENQQKQQGQQNSQEQSQSSESNKQQPQNSNKRRGSNYYRNKNRNKNPNIRDEKDSRNEKTDQSNAKVNDQNQSVGDTRVKAEVQSGELPTCPVCNSVIKNVTIAIKHRDSGEPAHFDCVLKQLRIENQDKMGKKRKVYYVGGGEFAIVKEKFDKRGRLKSYHVLERLSYEKREDD